MCSPFQVISLLMLSVIHLGWMLSQSFKVKEARGALQISIWKTGINNPDRQVITVRVSAPSSLLPNRSNESAPGISSALKISFQHSGHNTQRARRWLDS